MNSFSDYYDIKQPNIVKWFGRLWKLDDEIDRYHLEKMIDHYRYRLLFKQSIDGNMREEYSAYRKELIKRINSSPVEKPVTQYKNNRADTVAICFNNETPDYPVDVIDLPYTPAELLGDFFSHVIKLNELIKSIDKPAWIYGRDAYTALAISFAVHTICNKAYVEHGVNTYNWRTNPHCRYHRIAKEHDKSYEPVPAHQYTILTAFDHQSIASDITDPIRHLTENTPVRITYAMTPETVGMEEYQDYLYDWKNPRLQLVTDHHEHNLRLFIKNLTNP